MRSRVASTTMLAAALVVGAAWGASTVHYQRFPYRYGKQAYEYLRPTPSIDKDGPWSIGIYTGPSPFQLSAPSGIVNPVLTAADVTDIDARFVADPFMAIEGGRFYMFFEVLNRTTQQGDIGYAESNDGKKWEYKKIIVDEPFHLSYPYVFKWDDSYYMTPESHQDLSVRLYKATAFPGEWHYVKSILNGDHYTDPSIFRQNSMWWLLCSNTQNDALNLYYADSLLGTWVAHPMNPVVKLNRHISRPAGRVLVQDGHTYRFGQDDDPRYGIQVYAFEISELSKTSYKEKSASSSPVVTMTGSGWNGAGMHTVDAHLVNGVWMAAVDGQKTVRP